MVKLKIKKFPIDHMKSHKVILIIGRRGTGKSTLLKDILYHMRKDIDIGFAMTPTLDTQEMFEECFPKSHIYNDYSLEAIQNILKSTKALKRAGKKRSTLVGLDDCMFDKSIMKSKEMREIHMNGRHFCLCFINCMQYVMDMGPDLRSQVDYVFVLKENIINNRQKIHKYFFGMFNKYEEFSMVMDKCTNNYECLVLDNTHPENKVEEAIFYYKANPNIGRFRIGRSIFFKLDYFYQRVDEEEETRKRRALITGKMPCPRLPDPVAIKKQIDIIEKV